VIAVSTHHHRDGVVQFGRRLISGTDEAMPGQGFDVNELDTRGDGVLGMVRVSFPLLVQHRRSVQP
jgi:hypothetical protein